MQTPSVMELSSWDDFIEVAQGCRDSFYQVQGTQLTVYAGRVSWTGQSDKTKIQQLESMKSRKVVKVSEIERLFR